MYCQQMGTTKNGLPLVLSVNRETGFFSSVFSGPLELFVQIHCIYEIWFVPIAFLLDVTNVEQIKINVVINYIRYMQAEA